MPFTWYTLAEARSHLNDNAAPPFKYDEDALELNHDATVFRFEKWCRVAFLPRTETVTVESSGDATLYLPVRKVTAAPVGDIDIDALDGSGFVAYSGTVLAIADSWIVLSEAPAAGSLVKLVVTHGWAAVPAAIKRAALVYLRDLTLGPGARVSDTAIPSRAKAYSHDGLAVEFEKSSKDSPTGIAEVDEDLKEFRLDLIEIDALS